MKTMSRFIAVMPALLILSTAVSCKTQPVMGDYTVMDVDVEEISGLCLSSDKSFLWAVGDEGLLAKLSFDGSVEKVLEQGSDMEDVTLDPQTGDLYLAIEGEQCVYRVNSPEFNTCDTLFYVQEAIDGKFRNNGLEGIAYYKDNQIFVGAQEKATLWLFNLDGTIVWKKNLGQIAGNIDEVGGLCYDAETDLLWVADSDQCKLFVFDSECTSLVAQYALPEIENAESVCVDHANSCVWVGSDEDSPKLYKINFSNL